MRFEMRHEARQVPSWLIFDVRQKKNEPMQAVLAIGLLAISVVGGWFFARRNVGLPGRAIAYAVLWLASLLIACIPYFLRDPRTWIQTYSSAAMLSGIPSWLVHVLPAITAFHATRYCQRRKKRLSVCE